MAKNLATTFAALNNAKKIVDGESKKGSAPKATQNTTAKGVATQTATPTPVIEETPKKSTVQTSKATKPVSKAVNTVEKAKKAVSKYAPTLVELTGAVNPKKETNYGDVIRSAFDKKNANKANEKTPVYIPDYNKAYWESNNGKIPVLRTDKELINYYESLPDANILERLTSFEKNNAYKKKQALASDYQYAKDATVPSLLNHARVSTDDLEKLNKQAKRSNIGETFSMMGTSGGSAFDNISSMTIENYLKKKGLNSTDARYIADYLKRNQSNETNNAITDWTGKNTATKALGTLGSFPARAVGSTGDVVDKLANYLTGEAMTTDGSQASRIKNLSQNVRDVASENLGGFGKFAYDVGTSIGDMALASLLGNATGAGSTLAAGLMGSEKASDVINEGIERNLTPDQIMAEGVASGVTTYLTEKIPMGKWDDIAEAGFKSTEGIKYARELGKKIVASGVPELGQEAAEDIADAIADAIIAKDKSELNSTIRAYTAAGLSHEEATAQAWIDFAKQVGMDALAGFISGGVVGGGNAILRGTNAKRDARVENAANQVIENVGEIPFFNTQENTNTEVPSIEEITNEVVNNPELLGENPDNMALPEIAEGDVNNSEEALLPEYENLIEELESEDSYLPTNKTVADAIMQSMYNSGNAEMNRNANNSYSNPLMPLESVQNEQAANDTIPTYTPSENGLQSVENGEMGNPIRQNPNQKLIGKKGGKESQFSLNTLTNMPTFTQNEESAKGLKKVRKEGLFNYDPVTNKKTMDDAVNNLSADPSGEFERLVRQDNLSSATDVAESMLILDLMQKDVLAGKRSASEVWNFAKDMQKKVTGIGQGLQMLSHFTRTASSTLMKAEKMRDIKAKNIGGKEERAARKFSSTLERVLAKIGYDGTINNPTETQKTFEQILTEVKNTMDKESASVFDNFTEEDMQYLANLIHQGASEQRIYDALCMKLSTNYWDISEEDVKRVIEIFDTVNNMENPNSKEADDLENEAYAIMAKYLGDATFKEKWNQWRYLAMLGNPRTHIRNIFGNFLFGTLTNVKDNMAGIAESALNSYYKDNGIERQRAFVSRLTDNNLIKASGEDFLKSRYKQATDNSNKYMMDRDIERHRKIFKNKGLQKVSEFNTEKLDWEDTAAIKAKYSRALASYLKANGKGVDIFESADPHDVDLLNRARDFAVEQAKIATFHEDSSLANFLNGMSRAASASDNLGVKAVGNAIEAVVPFKRTPINILKQGAVEYNPVQLLNALRKAGANTLNAKAGTNFKSYSVSDVIDTFCRGLSGAGIAGLGAWLAHKGWLRGAGKDEQDWLEGNQEYSLTLTDSNGKRHSFTLDWAAPSALPLFIGAEFYNTMANKGEVSDFADVLASIANPAFEMSMLQGITDMMANFSKSNREKSGAAGFMGGIAGLGSSYVSQAVPTLGGQLARTIDPLQRDTYSGKEYGGFSDIVLSQLNKDKNKIPGLSYLSQPKIDALGYEKKNEDLGMGAFGRGVQNFLLPFYYSSYDANTSMDLPQDEFERRDIINNLDSLAKLAQESGIEDFKKDSIYPSSPNRSYDGKRLTPKEYTEYAKKVGEYNRELLFDLMGDSRLYANASPEEKINLVKEYESTANALARRDMFGATSKNNEKEFGIIDEKGVEGKMLYDEIKTLKGDSNSNAAYINAINNIGGIGLDDDEKGYYLSKFISNPSGDAEAMMEKYGDAGLYYWYSIASQSTKKAERYDAIEASDFPNDVKEALFEVLGESGKKNKDTSETPTQTTAQTTDRIPTLDEFINSKRTGQPLPEVTTKKSKSNADISNMVGSANGKTWVDFGQAVPYLESQGLSASERGQAYWNTGDKSSGKQKVYDDMGYPGVAQYYENQYHADQAGNQDNKKQKAEMKSYLKSLGFSNEDISYWMGVYGWQP